MTDSKRPTDKEIASTDIEAALRRLPQPRVPEHLQERLLQAIPKTLPAARPPWQVRWYQPALAAGIAAALIFGYLALSPRLREGGPSVTSQKPGDAVTHVDGRQSAEPGALSNTSPRYILGSEVFVLPEETRPCNVLPPLPG